MTIEETISNRATLNTAYEQRAQARAKREQGAQELERHKLVSARKRDALERAIAAETATSIDIADAPGLAQRRRDAEAEASAAERAQQAAQTKCNELNRALDAAQGEVERAVDQILNTELLAFAVLYIDRRDGEETKAVAEKIRAMTPGGIDWPVNRTVEVHPTVQRALELMPSVDLLNTPLNLHYEWATPAARAGVQARRVALISGEPVKTSTTIEAATAAA